MARRVGVLIVGFILIGVAEIFNFLFLEGLLYVACCRAYGTSHRDGSARGISLSL
jgi:hypothetical protein